METPELVEPAIPQFFLYSQDNYFNPKNNISSIVIV